MELFLVTGPAKTGKATGYVTLLRRRRSAATLRAEEVVQDPARFAINETRVGGAQGKIRIDAATAPAAPSGALNDPGSRTRR
jgi:hypothetical protein